MLALVTGATGKVGRTFLDAFLDDPRFSGARVRALVHNRDLPQRSRLESIKGSIADRAVVDLAMQGVTHVFHLATVKEDPLHAMDVSVKGMFHLLEAFRQSPDAVQFVHVSGDCAVGHIFVPYDGPITEASPRRAYPGVYALSKVLEETMLEQYFVQYGIDGVCLRAPWIMEKDDFRFVLSFGNDQFGGPPWSSLMSEDERRAHHGRGAVPLLLDAGGAPLRRSFVHASDLVRAMLAVIGNQAARQQLFNIGMNAPVDYGQVAAHLEQTRGMPAAPVATAFHSNWLDNAKARQRLAWEPEYGTEELIEAAFSYRREARDPRKIWYVG